MRCGTRWSRDRTTAHLTRLVCGSSRPPSSAMTVGTVSVGPGDSFVMLLQRAYDEQLLALPGIVAWSLGPAGRVAPADRSDPNQPSAPADPRKARSRITASVRRSLGLTSSQLVPRARSVRRGPGDAAVLAAAGRDQDRFHR
jgi:hypothetical protein